MKASAIAVAAALLLTARPLVAAEASVFGPHAVLPPSTFAQVLDQCSRATPPVGQSGWTPDAEQIHSFERVAPAAIHAALPDRMKGWPSDLSKWAVQYVGIVRDGHRYIYGNFFPKDELDDADVGKAWRQQPILVCDGGPYFFGLEYDVETGKVTHIAFNGPF